MANKNEIKGIDELEKVLSGIATALNIGITEIITDSADEIVNNTKKRTNRITGKLQDSWQHGEVQKNGDVYTIEIGSDCDYAYY